MSTGAEPERDPEEVVIAGVMEVCLGHPERTDPGLRTVRRRLANACRGCFERYPNS